MSEWNLNEWNYFMCPSVAAYNRIGVKSNKTRGNSQAFGVTLGKSNMIKKG